MIERRKTQRVRVEMATVLEVIGAGDVGAMSEELREVYESAQPCPDRVGTIEPFLITELSANGAFLAGPPLPLLSRVRFDFSVEERGEVEAIGWVMYRRRAACTIERWDGRVELPAGIGVLFESIPAEARVALADWARRTGG